MKIIPTIIPKGTYKTNDKFVITVRYNWRNSPGNDYTVSVYSKMEGVQILNSKNKTNQLFTDG